MIDVSNEGLLHQKSRKNMISFDSISEKQEESSNSSVKNSKLGKSKASHAKNKSLIKSNIECSKDGDTSITNISIRKRKRATLKNQKKKSIKDAYDNNYFKTFKRGEIKKKTTNVFMKRTSFQNDNNNFTFYNQVKNEDKRRSSKNVGLPMHLMGRTTLKDKKLFNIQNKNSLPHIYSNKNSIVEQNYVKNRIVNLRNSESFLDMKYFSNKKPKHTLLDKGKKFNFHIHKNVHSSSLFEKLKDSYLYEKSEATLFKIKILYAFLAFFSLLSIILEIIDVILYNRRAKEYLRDNYNIYAKKETNINNYYFIQNRKITNRENTVRIFNLIFSIICFFLHLIIHYIKYSSEKESMNRDRYNSNYYGYKRKKKSSRYRSKDPNNNNPNDNRIKFILNDNLVTKNFVTKEELIKLILKCIISVVFFPPGLNKVFIGVHNSVTFVFSLNILCLLFTYFKFVNIYFAVYYLSPFNNLLYKTICTSNMIKLDFKFMLRFLLNTFPMSFIIINFVILCIIVCILIFSIEHFSINIYNDIYNNKEDSDLTNFYNEISLYCFFVFKYIHGDIKPQTLFGSFILLVGGTMGLFLSSYCIYYINNLMEFSSEEQQAYSKLVKLLNPLNNEHKSANLLKVFLQINKLHLDNQNIEDNYRKRKENELKAIVQKTFGYRNSNFNFAVNDSNNSLTNLEETNNYKEKKKFLKYLCSQFVLKIKFLNEIKNFKNNLIIARNNTLSLNDILKTLGDKMNGNINQLNNKLEILIKNDDKYKNFMKFQENSLKKVEKIMVYQDFLLNYLIEKNNEAEVCYYEDSKEMINNFQNKYSNVPGGVGFRRLKSTYNGNFFTFKKKPTKKSLITETFINNGKTNDQNLKELIDNHNTIKKEVSKIKKLKSSILGNNKKYTNKLDFARSKTNPMKNLELNIKKNDNTNSNKNTSVNENTKTNENENKNVNTNKNTSNRNINKKLLSKSKSIDKNVIKSFKKANKEEDLKDENITKKIKKRASLSNKKLLIDEIYKKYEK